jgi:hypothetical protein
MRGRRRQASELALAFEGHFEVAVLPWAGEASVNGDP